MASFFFEALRDFSIGELVSLGRDESRHALKSRRLVVGDVISLIDGQGTLSRARIDSTQGSMITAELTHLSDAVKPSRLFSVVCALPKGDRARTLIEMLTQLGVSEITPLVTERSVVKLKENGEERLARYAYEACKQSDNPWLPRVIPSMSLGTLLARGQGANSVQGGRLVLADQFGEVVPAVFAGRNDVVIVVGPEGGFSPAELQQFDAAGVPRMRLSGSVLRTETAAVAAAAAWVNHAP